MKDDFDPNVVDWWAVDLAVKEGVRMNFNYSEKVIAAYEMKCSGWQCPDIAVVLRVDELAVEALWRRHERAVAKARREGQSTHWVRGGLHRQKVS